MPLIEVSIGDIFSAPANSVLLHACNCQGFWGAGVALEFKNRFPSAFIAYEAHCNVTGDEKHRESLLGTAQLIPYFSDDSSSIQNSPQYWIACLFTSVGYGRKRSSVDVILESTQKAIRDLEAILTFMKNGGVMVGDVWAVRINSGKFGVKWERTKKVLEECSLHMKVVRSAEANENLQSCIKVGSSKHNQAAKRVTEVIEISNNDDTTVIEINETERKHPKRSKIEAEQ